jgi:hypothetical protein
VRIRNAAADFLQLSWSSLRESDFSTALQHADKSWSLHHIQEAAKCGLIASVLMQKKSEMGKWLRRSKV